MIIPKCAISVDQFLEVMPKPKVMLIIPHFATWALHEHLKQIMKKYFFDAFKAF